MVSVVETLYTYPLILIDSAGFKIFYRSIYMIIVVRIVLESIDLVSEPVTESLSEIDIRFMCIERTVGVGSIQKPTLTFLVGDDIDHSANGIRTETYRYHPFVYFDAVGKVYRDVVQAERASYTFLWYTVNKHLDVLAAKTVQHELHVRTYAARFTEFHSRCFGQCVAQILRCILKFFCIDSHCVECRSFDSADSRRSYHHFIQFGSRRFYHDVQFVSFPFGQVHFSLYRFESYGRYD